MAWPHKEVLPFAQFDEPSHHDLHESRKLPARRGQLVNPVNPHPILHLPKISLALQKTLKSHDGRKRKKLFPEKAQVFFWRAFHA